MFRNEAEGGVVRYRMLVGFAAALVSAGCAPGITGAQAIQQELPFLRVGEVSRSEVELRLTREPTVHDRGNVLIYDLWRGADGALTSRRLDRAVATYHLVLLFDDTEHLQALNLVRVQPCLPADACVVAARRRQQADAS